MAPGTPPAMASKHVNQTKRSSFQKPRASTSEIKPKELLMPPPPLPAKVSQRFDVEPDDARSKTRDKREVDYVESKHRRVQKGETSTPIADSRTRQSALKAAGILKRLRSRRHSTTSMKRSSHPARTSSKLSSKTSRRVNHPRKLPRTSNPKPTAGRKTPNAHRPPIEHPISLSFKGFTPHISPTSFLPDLTAQPESTSNYLTAVEALYTTRLNEASAPLAARISDISSSAARRLQTLAARASLLSKAPDDAAIKVTAKDGSQRDVRLQDMCFASFRPRVEEETAKLTELVKELHEVKGKIAAEIDAQQEVEKQLAAEHAARVDVLKHEMDKEIEAEMKKLREMEETYSRHFDEQRKKLLQYAKQRVEEMGGGSQDLEGEQAGQ